MKQKDSTDIVSGINKGTIFLSLCQSSFATLHPLHPHKKQKRERERETLPNPPPLYHSQPPWYHHSTFARQSFAWSSHLPSRRRSFRVLVVQGRRQRNCRWCWPAIWGEAKRRPLQRCSFQVWIDRRVPWWKNTSNHKNLLLRYVSWLSSLKHFETSPSSSFDLPLSSFCSRFQIRSDLRDLPWNGRMPERHPSPCLCSRHTQHASPLT